MREGVIVFVEPWTAADEGGGGGGGDDGHDVEGQ